MNTSAQPVRLLTNPIWPTNWLHVRSTFTYAGHCFANLAAPILSDLRWEWQTDLAKIVSADAFTTALPQLAYAKCRRPAVGVVNGASYKCSAWPAHTVAKKRLTLLQTLLVEPLALRLKLSESKWGADDANSNTA